MAITISFGIQKGGVGKTTTCGITAYLLSKSARVLAVDFDSQGNLTAFLTNENIYNFEGKTALEACKDQDARPYIHRITDNLHILPAEDRLAIFSRFVYQEYRGNKAEVLKETLKPVQDEYDYILIDLPPNLGDQTLNALTASDYGVVMLQSEPFCYDALDRYLEMMALIQERTNPGLKLAGILATMFDTRTSIDRAIVDKAYEDYKDVMFKTVIKRRNRIKEFTVTGIQDSTKQDLDALEFYINFVKELKDRVQKK